MASTPEGKVKARVKDIISKCGDDAYCFWPVQTGMGSRTLDCLGVHKGAAFAIETKAPGKHPTEIQELIIEQMERAGVTVFVIGERETGDAYRYSGIEDLTRWLRQ